MNQYVLFKLEDESYGIEIEYVKTIEKISNITRVPNTKPYVKGVINLRGEVIPVIDLRERFGLPIRDYNNDTRVVIVSIQDYIIGLIVDSSSEVIYLNDNEVDNPPVVGEVNTVEFIKGIGKKDGKLIMLLNLKKVL
ncbi:chemotaxis protein CheW [Caloranaerobacter azorensis]|uniref:Purine-binding chemotaxis protein CheW n=1 Tax=Caloranaerobacter azorensis DSM 13643 TaxID=1121264 RepID=A0A1M5RKT9_9FIRM|nr:chemotaxis protein CheW [Caloranaerobacter azorensis]SHH26855.1 purine-binding chemotaxis protein CheW [Caloranaerobacter azorensis DSM 13643]